jgi:hypothetical protein
VVCSWRSINLQPANAPQISNEPALRLQAAREIPLRSPSDTEENSDGFGNFRDLKHFGPVSHFGIGFIGLAVGGGRSLRFGFFFAFLTWPADQTSPSAEV